MPQKIRTALLGYGLAGSVFHAPAISSLDDYSLAIIVTSHAERVAAAKADYPEAAVLTREEWEATGTQQGLDLVVVATPPGSHVPLAMGAIEANCAVVVDKPFTRTSSEGEALVAHAKERGVLLTTFQNRRWDGEFLTLKKLLAAGALGDVYRFESRLERWQPEITKPWKIEATVADGGGVLFDLGTHLIDQALQLFGPVTRIHGELAAHRPAERADDDAFVALQHANGVTSHLWMNLSVAAKGPRLRVLGSEAAYVKFSGDIQEEQLRAGTAPRDAGYGVENQELWGSLGRDGCMVPVPTERGNFAHFYELLAAAIRDVSPAPVDPADSIAGLRIIEHIRSSQIQTSVDT